jgi:hypothetical protein
MLSALVRTFAAERGITEARARLWISYLMLGGALLRANRRGSAPVYIIKGGVALALRLEDALAEPYEGFRFSRRGDPYTMANNTVRVDVAIRYHDAPWNTVQVDLSSHEGSYTHVDLVDAVSIARLGLDGPEQLPCLALPYHIAQKIHAMTRPCGEDRRPNDRFRDLVDLLLLAPLIEDYAALRAACDDVFESRATHAWPADTLTLPAEWREPYGTLAADVGGVAADFDTAVQEARAFIACIDAAR